MSETQHIYASSRFSTMSSGDDNAWEPLDPPRGGAARPNVHKRRTSPSRPNIPSDKFYDVPPEVKEQKEDIRKRIESLCAVLDKLAGSNKSFEELVARRDAVIDKLAASEEKDFILPPVDFVIHPKDRFLQILQTTALYANINFKDLLSPDYAKRIKIGRSNASRLQEYANAVFFADEDSLREYASTDFCAAYNEAKQNLLDLARGAPEESKRWLDWMLKKPAFVKSWGESSSAVSSWSYVGHDFQRLPRTAPFGARRGPPQFKENPTTCNFYERFTAYPPPTSTEKGTYVTSDTDLVMDILTLGGFNPVTYYDLFSFYNPNETEDEDEEDTFRRVLRENPELFFYEGNASEMVDTSGFWHAANRGIVRLRKSLRDKRKEDDKHKEREYTVEQEWLHTQPEDDIALPTPGLSRVMEATRVDLSKNPYKYRKYPQLRVVDDDEILPGDLGAQQSALDRYLLFCRCRGVTLYNKLVEEIVGDHHKKLHELYTDQGVPVDLFTNFARLVANYIQTAKIIFPRARQDRQLEQKRELEMQRLELRILLCRTLGVTPPYTPRNYS